MKSNKSKAPLKWEELKFSLIDPQPDWPPLYNLRFQGKTINSNHREEFHWSGPQIMTDRNLYLRMEAGCLHYGHEYFEGLTAHETKDGRCLLFRPQDYARRGKGSAKILRMPPFPKEMFLNACVMLAGINFPYLPPYESNGRLYIRAFCIGVNPQMGLGVSQEYMMIFYAYPVGNYYPKGIKPMSLYCSPLFDRVAERSTGKAKAGGNYVASYGPSAYAKEKDCGEYLYLDIATRRYFCESGSSNVLFLRADKRYITPKEASVLESITNSSLMAIAEELMDFKVEKRRVALEELKAKKGNQQFLEAGLCGTAARLTPISQIIYEDRYGHKRRIYRFPATGENGGPWCQELYQHLVDVQWGDEKDLWGWTLEVEPINL